MNISGTPGRKPFLFEKFWLTHPDFQENIGLWWKEATITTGTPMYKFQQKLKNLKQHLKSWNKSTFGNIFHTQEILNQQIQDLQQQIRLQGFTDSLKDQESILNKQLAVITLNCTTHAYLASGQLISLLCQNSAEQLFENPLVSRPTRPNPLLHACARWLTHYSPRVPNKARKKESCRWNKKLWVS
jgi:hypothetical protein